MKKISFIIALTSLAICLSSSDAAPIVVNFDSVIAPPVFLSVPAEQVIATPNVTISGGVILNQSGFANLATSPPNLYATTDFVGGPPTGLAGTISGVFNGLVNSIILDIINGSAAATFTLNAFDGGGGLVDSAVLAAFPGPGAVGTLSVAGPGIASFTVTSSQPAGGKDFAIDTLRFNTQEVPEPASIALWSMLSVAGIAAWRRRKNAIVA